MGFITVEAISIILLCIGFYGVMTRRSILKSIVSIGIIEAAAVLFFLGIGYNKGASPPIGVNMVAAEVSDPLPQALVITAIIIGVAVTAIDLTMFITMCHKHGTADWHEALKKRLE